MKESKSRRNERKMNTQRRNVASSQFCVRVFNKVVIPDGVSERHVNLQSIKGLPEK